ncbi:MAG: sigma-70 family RNA polymerase sigma factor [candidate division WOR-3 bacterium]
MSEKEKELLRKAKDGDEGSFEILMKENYQRIFQLAYRLMKNEDDAYELTSDTFLRAYQNLNRFRGDSSFFTYLYRICLNLGINRLKKKRLTLSLGERDFPTARGVLEEERNEKLREAIELAIQSLPPRERVVFILKEKEDKKIKEIAQILNLKEGTVKATYFQAVKKLRHSLKEWL